MVTKKNLPNIPIYIGDWERDCNVLTLESEAAWMRIVFKLWTKGKQNSIKMPAKSLQNLWRCSSEKMDEILDDLIFNEICDINKDGAFIEFTCRRFVKENKISKIRSEAASSSKNKTKPKQNLSKKEQISDNEIEIEIVNEIKNNIEVKNKSKPPEKKFSQEIENCFDQCVKEFPDHLRPEGGSKKEIEWKDCLRLLNEKDKIPFVNIAEIVAKTRGDTFWSKNFLTLTKLRKTNPDGIKYIVVFNERTQKPQQDEPRINRQTAETIRKNSQGWGITRN